MTVTADSQLGQIQAAFAEAGYDAIETGPQTLDIRDVDSGVTINAVLEGDIVFFSLVCTVAPRSAITSELMARMLAADNGISTSAFQIYDAGQGKAAVTLNNFCKLQDMGAEDKDDILSCVHFLMVDVLGARRVLGELAG
jgi:hypothetical protein